MKLSARAAYRAQAARLVEANPQCGSYAVDPYASCSIACTYCITGAQGRSRPRVPASEMVARLREELAPLDRQQPLTIGGLCDAYPPIEAELCVTRAVLLELRAQGRPIRIVTKGATVLRDIDLLCMDPVGQVTVSLSSFDEAALRDLEPGAPTPAERLGMIGTLAAAGVVTRVSVAPWIPGVTDVVALLRAVQEVSGDRAAVATSPLNVRAQRVASSRFARDWDQAAINEAFLAARAEAVGEPIDWRPLVPLAGHHAAMITAPLPPVVTSSNRAEG
jgi:DNA repair photolyase